MNPETGASLYDPVRIGLLSAMCVPGDRIDHAAVADDSACPPPEWNALPLGGAAAPTDERAFRHCLRRMRHLDLLKHAVTRYLCRRGWTRRALQSMAIVRQHACRAPESSTHAASRPVTHDHADRQLLMAGPGSAVPSRLFASGSMRG